MDYVMNIYAELPTLNETSVEFYVRSNEDLVEQHLST